jgi:hypothetical protein
MYTDVWSVFTFLSVLPESIAFAAIVFFTLQPRT